MALRDADKVAADIISWKQKSDADVDFRMEAIRA